VPPTGRDHAPRDPDRKVGYFQVLAEEGERAPPGVVGGRLVVDVGTLVVEESVVHAG